jgi:hypothetical protein
MGDKFEPGFAVTRAELAAALVRSGRAPQFVAKDPMYPDVTDLTTRNAVEAVQSVPAGALFCDVAPGDNFLPDRPVTRLTAAVALVKAAQLGGLAASSTLPAGILDANDIPLQWRGYVAVALQKGWFSTDHLGRFNMNKPLTRLDLTKAIVDMSR